MARGTAIRNRRRPLRQRAAQSDEGRPCAPCSRVWLWPGKKGVLCFAGHLRIDEAPWFWEMTGRLPRARRPATCVGGQPRQDRGAERAVAVESGAPELEPVQLPSHGRWRAIQSCRDLAWCVSGPSQRIFKGDFVCHHLNKVLHFVCEFRGIQRLSFLLTKKRQRPWIPDQVRDDRREKARMTDKDDI